jgi:hypothetical protein
MINDNTTSRKDDVGNSDKKELIHHLLLLADAANYFELTKLRQRIIETTKVLLKEFGIILVPRGSQKRRSRCRSWRRHLDHYPISSTHTTFVVG